METLAWFQLWFFIALQSISVVVVMLALRTREIPFKDRLAFSIVTLLQVGVFVYVYLYLLDVLQAETLDPLAITFIAAFFGLAETFLGRLARKHLLKIPPPTFREIFS